VEVPEVASLTERNYLLRGRQLQSVLLSLSSWLKAEHSTTRWRLNMLVGSVATPEDGLKNRLCLPRCFMMDYYLTYSTTLKMEVTCSSETSADYMKLYFGRQNSYLKTNVYRIKWVLCNWIYQSELQKYVNLTGVWKMKVLRMSSLNYSSLCNKLIYDCKTIYVYIYIDR
jgi:hypothetical protein